jgi:hypothetical protein
MVGQEQDPLRGHTDDPSDLLVGRGFPLASGTGKIEPAADQRGQLAGAGMSEPILLIAHRTRREDVERDTEPVGLVVPPRRRSLKPAPRLDTRLPK